MKELREYLFSKIKKKPPVWYYTELIDSKLSEFIADFIEFTDEVNSDKFSRKLLSDIHTLQFVSDDMKTHYFSFYSMYGLPKRLKHDGIINRIINNESLGLVLAEEEETKLPTVEEAANNIIPEAPKINMLYFVYINSRKETQIIDISEFEIESYLDESLIENKNINNIAYMGGHLVIDIIYKMKEKDEFGNNIIKKYLYTVNETYDNELDNKTEVELVSFNIYKLLENESSDEIIDSLVVDIIPMSHDVFEVNIKKVINNKHINNIYIYSSKYNNFINKFNTKNEPDTTYKIINILGNIDDGSLSIILKEKYNENAILNDILIASTKVNNIDDFDKYYVLPEAHKMFIKTVHGADIFYTVTQDPDNPESESMSQFNFFSIENGKLKTDIIKSNSMPTDIYINDDTGVLIFIYSIDVFYHMICYFYDGVELMRYSNVQLYPSDNVAQTMLDFKKHLSQTEVSQSLVKDEIENLHYYHTLLLSTNSDGREFITSSHFVNLTTNVVNYDVTNMNITKSGKFLEIKENKEVVMCMRVQVTVDPKLEMLEDMKSLQEALEELDK